MPDQEPKKYLRLHAIQLKSVAVSELHLEAHQRPDPEAGPPLEDMPLMVGHSDYDRENKAISVAVKVEFGPTYDKNIENEDEDKYPYSLKVEIVGDFEIDEDSFNIEYIDDWAARNAPMILQPYLREHVYSLTLRCGFEPFILPLLQVPTLYSGANKDKNETNETDDS